MAQYDTLRGDRLEFKVLYASSAEELHPAGNLELLPLVGDQAQAWTNLGWVSGKYCTYPQTLIFQFNSSALLKELRLVSHECLVGKKVDLFVGVGEDYRSVKFRRVGHVFFSSNRQTGFTAREAKLIRLEATANLFKLSITECHVGPRNMYDQVSLIAIEAYGITNVQHMSELNLDFSGVVKSKLNIDTDDPTSTFVLPNLPGSEWNSLKSAREISTNMSVNEVDQVLLSLGLGFDLVAASRPAITMEHATQRLLEVVQAEKMRAVNREDYSLAQKLQESATKLTEIGKQLIIEEENKHYAIACDDYKAAALAKQKIVKMLNERDKIAMINSFRQEALKEPVKQKPAPPTIKKLEAIYKPSPRTKGVEKKMNKIEAPTSERRIKPSVTIDGVHGETYAALQIQKSVRAKKERSLFKKKKKVALFIAARLIGNRARMSLTPDQRQSLQEAKERRIQIENEKSAVVKIQAVHRGRQSRRSIISSKVAIAEAPVVTKGQDGPETEKTKYSQPLKAQNKLRTEKEEQKEEVAAASKIQALARGNKARKMLGADLSALDRNERPVGKQFHGRRKVDPFGQTIVTDSPTSTPSQTPRFRSNENDPLQKAIVAWVEENLPDKEPSYPEFLDGFERHTAIDVITSFGETVAACAWSRKWKFRGAAIAVVNNELRALQGNVGAHYLASCRLCERLLIDRNPSVAGRAIALLRKLTDEDYGNAIAKSCNNVEQASKDIMHSGLDMVFPNLISRTGDANKSIQTKVHNLILEIGKGPVGPHYISKKILEAEESARSFRTLCGVTGILRSVVDEFGFTKESGITVPQVMRVAVADMKHANADVRNSAIMLTVAAYRRKGVIIEKFLIGINHSTLSILADNLKTDAMTRGDTNANHFTSVHVPGQKKAGVTWKWQDETLRAYIDKELHPTHGNKPKKVGPYAKAKNQVGLKKQGKNTKDSKGAV